MDSTLTTNTNEAPTTLATFAAWVTERQNQALAAMQGTQGEAFGTHCDEFMVCTHANAALSRFAIEQYEAIRSRSAAGVQGGAV